jgi:LacI family transcriptional regulator
LILDLHNHIHRGVMQGVCAFVRVHGPWNFVWIQQNTSLPWPALNELKLDGVIAYAAKEEQACALAAAGCAVVTLGERLPTAPLPAVTKDHFRTGEIGAEHLLERGLRSVVFCGHAALSYTQETAQGFQAVARRGGARCHEIVLKFPLHADWHWEDHAGEIIPWLEALPRPAGVLACNDYFARQILAAAESLGRKVPDDFAIVGINDNPIECQLSHVPISSVAMAAENMGWEACRLLCGQIERRANLPEVIRVPPLAVIARQSSDVFAVEDRAVAGAVRRIHAGASHALNVDELVRGTGLSRRAFEVRFRRCIGHSPYEEILRLRVARARELLARTGLTVGAIAEECGFGNAKVFHRHFRKQTGVTPAAYRTQVGRQRAKFG